MHLLHTTIWHQNTSKSHAALVFYVWAREGPKTFIHAAVIFLQVHKADARLANQSSGNQAARAVHVWWCRCWQDHAHGSACAFCPISVPGQHTCTNLKAMELTLWMKATADCMASAFGSQHLLLMDLLAHSGPTHLPFGTLA